MGGTGKTPTVLKLYEIFKNTKLKVSTAKKFYSNQEDVDSSLKATEDFMANWKGSIKDALYLHGPVSLNYSKDKIK